MTETEATLLRKSPNKISPVKRTRVKDVLLEEVFSRIAETPLVPRNGVRLLKDAAENYPAWLEAIKNARKTIHFESFIIHEDKQGWLFADALIAKAKEGVRVRVIYDWIGGFGKTSRKYWQHLRHGGVEVRCYNPPRFDSPLGWINRDHRKILTVDGEVAFVTGLCVGQMWVGYPDKGIEAWRDTGVEIRGKAVADVEESFAEIWATMGAPLSENNIVDAELIEDAGEVSLRVVASSPSNARIYRLDQIIASMAQKTLWLTDAYFSATDVYTQTLRSAALDGVDVRLLVPAATDIPIMRAISRSGYRALLEVGVKVYEWNGTMLHAKTAVVDGFWSRVGSTNLNVASWLGNCELDVLIEDEDFGRQMQEMYLNDLQNATEIILSEKNKTLPVGNVKRKKRRLMSSSSKTARYAPSAIVIKNALGASFTTKNKRRLGAMEAKIALVGGFLLLALGAVGFFYPRVIAVPLGVIFIWFAVSLFINAVRLFVKEKENEINSEEHPKRELENKDV